MKHELAAHRIDARDLRLRDVLADHAVGVVAADEDRMRGFGVWGLRRLQRGQQLRVDRHESLAAVFRCAGAHDHVRTLVIEAQIAPNELAQFSDTQAGVSGRHIEQTARAGHGEEAVELLVGKRAALALPAARVRLRHTLQRIARHAALTLQPIEKGVHGVEVFVEGLRTELRLARAPPDEAVRCHVPEVFPTALGAEFGDAGLHLTAVDLGAAEGRQVGDKVREMGEQGLLGRLALHFGRDQSGAFALLFGNDLGEPLFSDLLVGGFERDLGDDVVATETEPAAINPAGDNLASLVATLGLEGVGDHGRRVSDVLV
jgi:hypothetical protein